MRISIFVLASLALGLSACAGGTGGPAASPPTPERGGYVYPEYLRPQPPPYQPLADACGYRLYRGLVGTHIGAVHVATIQGRKRIIQPGVFETVENEFLPQMQEQPPYMTVTDILPGQPLYAATVRTGLPPGEMGPDDPNRLTISLDEEGYITDIGCR